MVHIPQNLQQLSKNELISLVQQLNREIHENKKPSKLQDIPIDTIDAFMFVHDETPFMTQSSPNVKVSVPYKDLLTPDNCYVYHGQNKNRQYDELLFQLYNKQVKKPIILVHKFGDNVMNIYNVTTIVNHSHRTETHAPILVLRVDKLDPNVYLQKRTNRKHGVVGKSSFEKQAGIEYMIRQTVRSGIKPIKIHSQHFRNLLGL